MYLCKHTDTVHSGMYSGTSVHKFNSFLEAEMFVNQNCVY
jgi:hypothetical protein